ncbi:hypothetical protein [Actinokineospora iranica]|uniref:Uncharacterized protein n=1 Tax=Actinokineospora iranica TaxID=1271860 RepID=A0A1G6LTD2_9PSEU|nr:hypothetical protein [Actinokineospora iranica]SDC45956.1 hypothetical protein SAMN05216174_102211 [Actinokineospora iranica]
MIKNLARAVVAAAMAGLAFTGAAAPALADPVIVDEPDTSDLNDTWTFAPLGVPVFGLIPVILRAPNGIIPD